MSQVHYMRGHLAFPLPQIAAALPLLPLELVARRLVANVVTARPAFLARLGEHRKCTFAIDPVDCPFVFLITLSGQDPKLRLQRSLNGADYAARVSAPLLILLGLLEGCYDGDALFFSRDLVIEGNTEAVVALRNALEDAEIDPATISGLPAGMKEQFNRAATLVFACLRRALDAPESENLTRGTGLK